MPQAVVLLNMGAPHNLEEVELFLRNMFNDPHILPIKSALLRKVVASFITKMRVKEAKKSYEELGGKSPLNDYTRRLVVKLERRLGGETIVRAAMRYTPPFVHGVIEELMEREIDEVYLIPLYPHYSITTTQSSLDDFYGEAKKMRFHARFYEVREFYDNEKFNDAVVERIEEALKGENFKEYDLLFSAHSLPKRFIEMGDPYLEEVQNHVELLKERIGWRFNSIHLAFQSKIGPIQWLEPSLDEKLAQLKGRKVLVYPISFVLDNSETLFELHKVYRERARELGVQEYRVARCPNDSNTFVEALVDIYENTL
ncbi:MAG: ferrochelatase [Epsilonproteobacteria bacterium]|nr:ferrochelatase [Campylobacterota bacterium]NPA57201.1 ferrochelatase [Campylobacterota bacterium]